MSAQAWFNDGGTARKRKQRWVNDAGTARRIKERWVNDNGVARCVWRETVISLLSGTYTNPTAFGVAFFSLEADGSISYASGSPTQTVWITPQVDMADYEVMATQVSRSGVGVFSGTLNNWLSLAPSPPIERAWSANRPNGAGSGQDIWVLSLSIRRKSDLVIMATGQITLISQG